MCPGENLQMSSSPFDAALQRIDAVHAEDPQGSEAQGARLPQELLYAQRMSACLERLVPEPSEALRLAVRAQHLRRWRLPRSAYPIGRAGYHAWRRELGRLQAEEAAAILGEAGCEPALCERVASLIRKENLRSDPEAQALEDVACLVFLGYYLHDFAAAHSDEKVIGIIRRTWSKMSSGAQELALRLELSAAERALVDRALEVQ
jgi:hypothetical protein